MYSLRTELIAGLSFVSRTKRSFHYSPHTKKKALCKLSLSMYMMYIQKWSFYKILPSRTHAKRLTFVKKSPFRPKQKFEVLLYLWSVPNMIPNRKKEPDLTSQERKRIISWLLDARIWKKARCGWRSGYFPGLAKTFATFFCTAVQAWCQLKRVVCGLEPAINSVRREYRTYDGMLL
jgi:hypothetical protein